MERKQHYIGTPVGCVLSVDETDGVFLTGHYLHGYVQEPVEVHSISALLLDLEKLFNRLNFPQASTNERSFTEQEPVYARRKAEKRIHDDADLLAVFGSLATFIIRVFQRQNSTWQGSVTWVEKDKTLFFSTVEELVRELVSALRQAGGIDR